MNESYTEIWTTNFGIAGAEKHDKRFRQKFEKNIKHRQQVDLLRKHINGQMKWLDFPVGPARLMREITAGAKHGYDISDGFLAFSSQHGIHCKKQDLFAPVDTGERFDVITSFHTLFAFNTKDQINILKSFHQFLNNDGLLIFDPVNRRCRERRNNFRNELVPDDNCFYKEELQPMLESIGFEIQSVIPHDCIDNPSIISLLRKCRLYRFLNKAYFLLKMFPVFNLITRMLPESANSKFIVVAKRMKSVEPTVQKPDEIPTIILIPPQAFPPWSGDRGQPLPRIRG